jgi:protein O-GlcNAc transferase
MASDDEFDRAAGVHGAGRIAEAEALFRRIVAAQPGHAEAAHHLAVCLCQRGELAAALPYFDAVLRANPAHVGCLNNLGNALQALRRYDAALDCYQRAIALDPGNATFHSNRGNCLKALGRHDEALASYARALALNPDQVTAYFNRGTVLHELHRFAEALADFDQAIARAPDHASAYGSRGVTRYELKRHADALADFDRAIALAPHDGQAWSNRANALRELERYDEALASCDRAIALAPDRAAAACNNRGLVLNALERYDEALACYDRALALDPGFAEALNNRGVTLAAMERPEQALRSYDQALAARHDYAEAFHNRANALKSLRRFDEAVASCDRAIELNPDAPDAHNSRGHALCELRRYDEALASYDRALALEPDHAEALNNRGAALAAVGRFDAALASYDRALAAQADYAEALYNRANALKEMRRLDEALASCERALRLNPGLPDVGGAHLNLKLTCCNWDDLDTACAEVLAAVDRGERAATPFSILAIPSTPSQQQRCAQILAGGLLAQRPDPAWRGERYDHERVRIGYFSADLQNHATAHLMAELIERHDHSRFETIALSFGPSESDDWRARLQRGFDRFIDVRQKTDAEIAALARELEIDIAVDLKGYTRDARPGVFARRPAPVQVSYLGYPGTMGAPFIDYLIADSTLIPPEHRAYYDEKIVYLPHSYQPNDSTKRISEPAPGRAALGLPEDAFVFCCFNNNYKITPDVFAVWMRLLGKVERSVLWLLASNRTAAGRLLAEAGRRGIARERLVLATQMPLADHLARHRAADLFLDTFHYNAHTTASDALWAGLPVLTCLGGAFAGRVAASLLTAIGLPELITRSHDDYEALALDLATHPERLAAIRGKLALNRTTLPLFDTPRYARHLEQAYARMHERHRAGLPPDHIVVEA